MTSGHRTILLSIALIAAGSGGYLVGKEGAGLATMPRPEPVQDSARQREEHGESTTVTFDPDAMRLAGIELKVAEEAPMPSGIVLTGEVSPNLSGVAKITTRVSGKATAIYANVGDSVRAGETLAIVSSSELAEAQAEYRQAQASLALAKSTLQRQLRLAGLGEFGRHKVEDARSNLASLQAEVLSAQNEAISTKAEIAEAESGYAVAAAAREQAESALGLAETKRERAETLYQEQIVSRQDLEQTRADVRKAASDLQASRAAEAQANSRVSVTKAKLRLAEGKVVASRRRLETGRQALTREEAVFRSGVLTSKEVSEAETAARKAELDVRGAEDAIRLLGGRPGGGNAVAVTAPISGRITERSVTLGETVTTDKALFSLVNLTSVWVELNAPQSQLARIRVGMPVQIASQSLHASRIMGTVANVGDVLDETTRTAKVRVVVNNRGSHLKPGAFVSGMFVGPSSAQSRRTLTVPSEAVQDSEGKKVVYVQGSADGEFLAVEVQTGEEAAGLVEIASGLEPGQRYVAKGALMVKAQAMKGELGHED